jgi:hypothetical protein
MVISGLPGSRLPVFRETEEEPAPAPAHPSILDEEKQIPAKKVDAGVPVERSCSQEASHNLHQSCKVINVAFFCKNLFHKP